MKAALDGKEQSFQGLDHTGHYITAASTFLTYAGFRIGLVGTVSNHDVVARLMQNAVITLILSLLFAVSAAFVFQRLGNPILVKLSRQSRSLKRELETRRGVETQLSESVEFLSESQRIGHVGSYSLDIASGIWTASDVLENLFGIDDRIEHTLEMWVSLIHPADREKASGHFLRHVLTEGNRFDLTYRIIRKNDGAIRWLHCLGELTVKDGVAVRMVGTIRDVTENTELIQSLRSWEQLFAHSAWGIVIVDAETNRIVSSNPALDTMYGYSHDELIGMSVFDLYAPESRPVARGIANDMSINHDHCCFESLHVRKDGTRFPVEVDVCARDFDGTGTPHIRAANIVDISERKRIESDRERAERSMMETQRLESLGVLAGGIAHDFNNVLMTVLGNANLALQEISTESAAAVHLESIVTAAGTASGLTRQMLAYAGKGKYDVSTVLLNKIVSQMSALLDVSISKSVMLRTELDPTDPVILADEAQIQQVVMNLVVNASEAIGAACGTVTITTGIRPCDHVYLNSGSAGPGLTADAELPEGDYAVLEVADSGSGMDEKTLARLFDPFFSTKYQGRGLGLASVQGIVRGHHGVIRVNSELGKGTTFKILFPLDVDHDSVRPEVASDERLRQSWTGSGLVLLADDDDSVRKRRENGCLSVLAFDVIEARDGRAAVDLFTERADEFVCAIIDLTMPHLDGTAVVRELNAIPPGRKNP